MEPSIQQLFDLSGKTALVTGASGHLGRSIASALAEARASVIVTSRDIANADATVKSLPFAERHYAIELDHCKEDSILRAIKTALTHVSHIDIVVNNGHEGTSKDWTSLTHAEFTEQLSNASGYFTLSKLVRDHAMANQYSCSIIMMGSMYGIVGSYPEVYEGIGSANPAAYQALKGGIIQLTRHLAVYWAKDGIRVNCLSPGPFPHAHASTELVERLSEKVPMKRMGTPYELKGAIVFLASEASSYMTGQNLVIDGGWTAW